MEYIEDTEKNCLTECHLNNYQHRMCEPRSVSEAISAQIASESECQAGRLTERHLLDVPLPITVLALLPEVNVGA